MDIIKKNKYDLRLPIPQSDFLLQDFVRTIFDGQHHESRHAVGECRHEKNLRGLQKYWVKRPETTSGPGYGNLQIVCRTEIHVNVLEFRGEGLVFCFIYKRHDRINYMDFSLVHQ